MAKPPPATTDRFRIFAETTSENMGPLLAQLTRMGLENIGYELVTDVVRFNRNERTHHEINGEDFTRAYMAEHPTFRAADLFRHFEENDRRGKSAYSAVRQLVDKKELINLGDSNYRRADVKVKAPQAAKKKPTHTRRGKSPRFDVPNEVLLLKHIKARKRITVVQAGAFLEGEGRSKKSASPLISKFAADGLLKQIEPGVYAVKKTGAAKASVKRKEKEQAERAAKLNGQTSSTEEASHG